MKPNLHDLYKSHTGKLSDKWELYLSEFDNNFQRFRDAEINLFEIGVQNGGSLEIWAKYFPKAKHIIGCDIDETCKELEFSDPRISLIIGNANSDEVEDRLRNSISSLDIVIDDGSHKSSDIIKSFSRYIKYQNYNGLYIIEDLHASYWDEYEGGLHYPYSAISFLKRLVDLVNYEHWTNEQRRTEFLEPYINGLNLDLRDHDLCKIHSIEFINSLCIIQIKPHQQNLLGHRIVMGSDGLIFPEIKYSEGNQSTAKPLENNNYDSLDVFSLIRENEKLQSKVGSQLEEIQQLNIKIEQSKNLFEKRITEENIQKRQLEEEVRNYKQIIEKNRTDLRDKENQIKKFNDVILGKEKIIAQMNHKLEEREQVIKEIKTEMINERNFVQELRANVNIKENKIAELNSYINQREQKTNQLQIDLVSKSEKINNLKNKLIQQNEDIEFFKSYIFNLQQEILSYTTSTSWRFTRPLRKISKLFKRNKNA